MHTHPLSPPPLSARDHITGPPTAPVVLLEYGDES